MFCPTKREMGTMLQAAPAFANQGVCLICSVFARVIVGLLVEAEAPELKHLWVFADDQPCAAREGWKAENGEHSEPSKENRYGHKHDDHPRRKLKPELGSRPVQSLID